MYFIFPELHGKRIRKGNAEQLSLLIRRPCDCHFQTGCLHADDSRSIFLFLSVFPVVYAIKSRQMKNEKANRVK